MTASPCPVPGHFKEETEKWSTVLEISQAQKSPQHLHKIFGIRKQRKAKIHPRTSPLKEISAFLLLQGQVLQSMLHEQHQTNYRTPWATPTTQKATLTPPLLLPPQGSFPKEFTVHASLQITPVLSSWIPVAPQQKIMRVSEEKHRFHTAGATVWREVITQKLTITHYPGYTAQFKHQKPCRPRQHSALPRPAHEASPKPRVGASSSIYAQDCVLWSRCALNIQWKKMFSYIGKVNRA